MLGDEIYFAQSIPWIWGSIDQVHGKIDIQFAVKGTRGKGMMRFRSERPKRMGYVCAPVMDRTVAMAWVNSAGRHC